MRRSLDVDEISPATARRPDVADAEEEAAAARPRSPYDLRPASPPRSSSPIQRAVMKLRTSAILRTISPSAEVYARAGEIRGHSPSSPFEGEGPHEGPAPRQLTSPVDMTATLGGLAPVAAPAKSSDEAQARVRRAWSVEANDPRPGPEGGGGKLPPPPPPPPLPPHIHTPSVIRALVIESSTMGSDSDGDETSVSDSGSD